jgi:AcrR family transcriptional regulator
VTVSLDSSLSASKGERTRAALIDAAIACFAADGFQRTSLTRVAQQIRVSPTAVYRYYSDKEALFAAAFDADAAALVALARRVLTHTYESVLADESALPVTEGVAALIESVVGAVDEHPLVARVLAGDEPMTPERILEVPSLAALREELAGLLELGQEVGYVKRELPAEQLALGIETILLTQLAYAASLRKVGEPLDPNQGRWEAVAMIIDAAIRPDGGARDGAASTGSNTASSTLTNVADQKETT